MKLGRFNLKWFSKAPGGEDEYNDPPKPFMEHLYELRDCLVKCAIAWVVCVIIVIPFAPKINEWIMAPAQDAKTMIQGLTWTVGFSVIMKIMMWGGTALAMPFLLAFIMQFVFPGLKRSERNIIVFILVTSTVFFLGGVWMAYSTTLQVALRLFQDVNRWMGINMTIITMEEHISIVIKTIVAFGLAFQLPLLLLALGWIGMISSDTLANKRRIAIVTIFILAMVLTPPDPLSQMVMALPMCLLYEVCIWVIRLREVATGRRSSDAEKKGGPKLFILLFLLALLIAGGILLSRRRAPLEQQKPVVPAAASTNAVETVSAPTGTVSEAANSVTNETVEKVSAAPVSTTNAPETASAPTGTVSEAASPVR